VWPWRVKSKSTTLAPSALLGRAGPGTLVLLRRPESRLSEVKRQDTWTWDAYREWEARQPGALCAQEPVAVLEVLSRSTSWINQSLKPRDYDATPSIRTYVLISQDEMRALVYARDDDGRLGIQNAVLFEGPDASIEIAEFGLALPFSALYEGVQLA
jgi:Uma2 family endonuclease